MQAPAADGLPATASALQQLVASVSHNALASALPGQPAANTATFGEALAKALQQAWAQVCSICNTVYGCSRMIQAMQDTNSG
jgi:hypothetical protein